MHYCTDKGEELQHLCYAVISNELQYDKVAAFAFNKKILEDAKSNLPWDIKKVHYWSGGAVSQFKNRYNVSNQTHHEAANWSFSPSPMAKGQKVGK